MSIINYASREIQFKIVYYGPALCGKTTNLSYIHQRINPLNRGDLVSLATATERTLFFDFLPLNAVVIKGFVTKFQLYTVPGQVIYNATRQLVLRSVDGIVFVADSASELARGGERTGRERCNHRHVHRVHVAALRNYIAAAIDHHRELGLGLFEKITEHAIERRHIFNRQDRNGVHAGSFWVSGVVGSTGIATGSGAPWGASLCLLNL